MGEADYQLALLLQYKFKEEQENNSQKICLSDSQLARSLQEHYKREYDVENPGQNLVYKSKKQKTDGSHSLTDPSWEVIDPTPDIHILFVAFSERFFWNKLSTVCVSWSKRMTSCAGICSYQGGMCSITLSEPLLKLRPRKDLVETLLHEMIHAYLFLTHNNRDRDGHGVEFHKHMWRINKEAGTNITVYHDFHDEVQLYKQHWWRCNGPCQKWKPYFGMVRRAMNRAPGPSDRWWAEHSRNCGGNFIKVKEPEKLAKKSVRKTGTEIKISGSEIKNSSTDIRKFISPVQPTKTISNSSVCDNSYPSIANKVHSVSKNDNSSAISPKTGNIFEFTNLIGKSPAKFIGSVKNNTNTIVINKKNNSITKEDKAISKPKSNGTETGHILSKSNSLTGTGPGRAMSDRASNSNNADYTTVRNHWANKFSDATVDKKFKSTQNSPNSQRKVPTLPPASSILIELSKCPVCAEELSTSEMNKHLDTCLVNDNTKECILCGIQISSTQFQVHYIRCSEEIFNDDVFETSTDRTDLRNSNKSERNIQKQCEVCNKMIQTEEYNSHLNECLLKMYNEFEASYGKKDEMVDCLVCDKRIMKSNLNSHLEDCISMNGILEKRNEPVEGEGNENKYDCPFCMKSILKEQMNNHIDTCLNIVENSLQYRW